MLVKNNVKLGLGVDATWAKPILKDPFSDKEEYEDKKEHYSTSTEHKTVYNDISVRLKAAWKLELD